MATVLIPSHEWRHLLRSLLRESSYLPDPIAKSVTHYYIIQRFRRYSQDRDTQTYLKYNPRRQTQLFKNAKRNLGVLKRANEGYLESLETILQRVYGRRGKRRVEMLNAVLAPVPADTSAVEALLDQPPMFSDEWRPPLVMRSLLIAQRAHKPTALLGHRATKQLEPDIPKENAWGKPLAKCRKRNIRRKWYNSTLASILPPLPDAELQTLEGLLLGTVPWTPPKRRKAVGVAPRTAAAAALDVDFLTEGPQKSNTFEYAAEGRPHIITRRFMERIWKRISALVPRMTWDATSQKHSITWDNPKAMTRISASIKDSEFADVFKGVDARGRLTSNETKSRDSA